MIKILRIISIVAAIAAVVLLVLPVVYGVRIDPKIEKFLQEPGAADKFAAGGRSGTRGVTGEDRATPLVKQAADFARYLNPPPPPAPVIPAVSANRIEPAPFAPVSIKFDLIGTSFYAARPELSLALIDEPGKGLHWVREGNNVGHLTIEKIGDGSITVRDGQKTSEMTVKVDELWRKLLKNPSSETNPAASASSGPTAVRGLAETSSPVKPGPAAIQRPRLGAGGTPSPAAASAPAPPAQTSNEEQPTNDKPNVEESPLIKEKEAQIDLLVNKLGSSEITEAEAAKLNDEIFKLIEQLGEARAAEQSTQPQSKSPPNAPADAKK